MRTVTFALGLLLLATAPLSAQTPPSLERALVRVAPDVLKYCREKGYKTVGVLKFLVHKGGQDKLSDSAGTLNRTVARQLEVGLILANSARDPLNVIDDASEVAAKTPGANHLTKDGRLKLFEPNYPLAWGKERLPADVFITGVVGVADDLKTLKVTLFAFDKATNKLEPVGKELVAANDPRKLSELGESFSTRGAFDDGSVEPKTPEQTQKKETDVLEVATKVREKTVQNPAQDAAALVKLDVLYDGKSVPIEVKDGTAFVPEPTEGQKVVLHLKRNTPKGILACVLKVNGESTLFRQKKPDLQCRKWLLFPEDTGGIKVAGFQKDDKTTEEFRVLSKVESKAREINYGADVGTITLTVFQAQKGKEPRGDLSDEALNTRVVEKATLPAKKPDNFNALTAQLLDDANRGLLEGGNTVGSGIQIIKFNPDPTPVMSLTIVYYKK